MCFCISHGCIPVHQLIRYESPHEASEEKSLPRRVERCACFIQKHIAWPFFCCCHGEESTFKSVKPSYIEGDFFNGQKFLARSHISMNMFVLLPINLEHV